MLINALNDTSSNLAQIMNDPASGQVALGARIAASNANASYAVMAKLGQETLPLVRNAIELVIIGIFPIVFLLIIIADTKGGGMVLRTYVTGMFWVQLLNQEGLPMLLSQRVICPLAAPGRPES